MTIVWFAPFLVSRMGLGLEKDREEYCEDGQWNYSSPKLEPGWW